MYHTVLLEILKGGKLAKFAVLWLATQVFSASVVSFGVAKVSNLGKISPRKSYFFPNLRKFSLSKVSRYTDRPLANFCGNKFRG